MNASEKKYKQQVDWLRKNPPVLESPELLTHQIMERIIGQSGGPAKKSNLRHMDRLRPILAAAAALLLGVFIIQSMNKPEKKTFYASYTMERNPSAKPEPSRHIKSHNSGLEKLPKNFIDCLEKTKKMQNTSSYPACISLLASYKKEQNVARSERRMEIRQALTDYQIK